MKFAPFIALIIVLGAWIVFLDTKIDDVNWENGLRIAKEKRLSEGVALLAKEIPTQQLQEIGNTKAHDETSFIINDELRCRALHTQ